MLIHLNISDKKEILKVVYTIIIVFAPNLGKNSNLSNRTTVLLLREEAQDRAEPGRARAAAHGREAVPVQGCKMAIARF